MWIVSQNGTIISNTDTMQGITVDGGVIEIWHDGNKHNLLGRYSTQEKAIKVRCQILYAKQTNVVEFQMPEDEDVVV